VEREYINQQIKPTQHAVRKKIDFLKQEIARLTDDSIELKNHTNQHLKRAIEAEKQYAVFGEQFRQEK
jgi:hypothetical protein